MTHLIGLHGFAQTGKDTVGEILVRRAGFTRLAFADRMREMLLAINPLVGPLPYEDNELARLDEIVNLIGWDRAKVEYAEVRELLQRLGTEGGRKLFGEDFWVDLTMAQLGDEARVITDVRFENEANAIWLRGGEVWRITRPGTGPVNDHASDAGLPERCISRTIINDGTLDQLEAYVLECLA